MEIKTGSASAPIQSRSGKVVPAGGVVVNIQHRQKVTIDKDGNHIDPLTKRIIRRNDEPMPAAK